MNFLNRKTVEDIDVTGKRVLVRCDYNVPFDSEGNITDTKRIDESIKTLRYLIDHNAKVIIWGKCKSSLFQFTRRPSNDAGKCPL